MHDVAIIGAGPAGLSAALVLGRCRRKVVVFDSGKPRNAASRGLHGYLTRDGTHPLQLRELGRADVSRYPTVSLRDLEVSVVRRLPEKFELRGSDGSIVASRILLLATGRVDLLPEKPGFRELYGRGVYHCPICDGWEHRDQPFAAYGREVSTLELALALRTWSDRVAWCTDGAAEIDSAAREKAARNRITVLETPVAELRAGADGLLERVLFAGGGSYPCAALFFDSATVQRSSLPENLGCEFDETGAVRCNDHAATNVPGLFVAGNVRCGVHLAITAAAEGAEAAIAIHEKLTESEEA